jgi:hypothetical protein
VAVPRGGGRPVIDIDQATFAATMRVLKAVDKNLYDGMRKTIRQQAALVKTRQAGAVTGLAVRGASGQAASNRRAGFALARSSKGDASRITTKSLAKAVGGSGLRASAAKALKVEYRERATAKRPFLGARVRMSSGSLPPEMRRLPKHMNYGSWRHPVFGNRDAQWVEQKATPVGWFDGTFAQMKASALKAIDAAMKDAYRKAGLSRT